MNENNGNHNGAPRRKILARTITTAQGVFVSVDDFRQALADERLLLESAAMIKVAQKKKLHPLTGIRLCIANALNEVTGMNQALEEIQRDAGLKNGRQIKPPGNGN